MAMPTLITVTGTYLQPDGTAESGKVFFTVPTFLRHNASDDVVAPGVLKATLDASGNVSLQVPATDDAAWSPQGWTYRVEVRLSASTTTFDAAIPAASPGGTLDLTELLPAQPADGVLYAPVAHIHDDRYMTDAEVSAAIAAALTSYLPKAGPSATGTLTVGTQTIDGTAGTANLGGKNGLQKIQWCGRKTTPGAPTTGTWAQFDCIVDSQGTTFICTAGGTPGTWL